MKKEYIIISILVILVVAATTLVVLRSPEDSWICTGQGWQKHGQPTAAMPTTTCGEVAVTCPPNSIDDCPEGCSVCPPCEVCSSLACQPKAKCEAMGFKDDWYDSVKAPKITNFAECAAAGNPIMESYPRQCASKGETFTEEIATSSEDKSDLIVLDTPKAGEVITSPLVIKGKARGNWFFEASFPVVLTNWDGLIIAEGLATAKEDWMTEEFVPFDATLTFEKPGYGERGALILQKDNPSGLPENDDALEITIIYDQK